MPMETLTSDVLGSSALPTRKPAPPAWRVALTWAGVALLAIPYALVLGGSFAIGGALALVRSGRRQVAR